MFLKPHYFKQYPKAKLLPDLGLDCYRSAVMEWDLDETKAGGPFKEILDFDILVNCILLAEVFKPDFLGRLSKDSGDGNGNMCQKTNRFRLTKH